MALDILHAEERTVDETAASGKEIPRYASQPEEDIEDEPMPELRQMAGKRRNPEGSRLDRDEYDFAEENAEEERDIEPRIERVRNLAFRAKQVAIGHTKPGKDPSMLTQAIMMIADALGEASDKMERIEAIIHAKPELSQTGSAVAITRAEIFAKDILAWKFLQEYDERRAPSPYRDCQSTRSG